MNTLHWKSIVVIGGGLAGAKAAEGARAAGFDGLIRLIGDEAHSPYERPPLSKGFLAGKDTEEAIRINSEGLTKSTESSYASNAKSHP